MIEKKKKFKLGDFDYPLPKKYIAQYPGEKRDQSKLMVVDRDKKTIAVSYTHLRAHET